MLPNISKLFPGCLFILLSLPHLFKTFLRSFFLIPHLLQIHSRQQSLLRRHTCANDTKNIGICSRKLSKETLMTAVESKKRHNLVKITEN